MAFPLKAGRPIAGRNHVTLNRQTSSNLKEKSTLHLGAVF